MMKNEPCHIKRDHILMYALAKMRDSKQEDTKNTEYYNALVVECEKWLREYLSTHLADYCPNWKKENEIKFCVGGVPLTCDCGCIEGSQRCDGINHRGSL
jgi:hypothetical protein